MLHIVINEITRNSILYVTCVINEILLIQFYICYIRGTLITEQQVNEINPLYSAANITRIIPNSTRSDTVKQEEE